MPASKKICFVIAPIGEEGSDIRRRSDQVLNYIIVPAVGECGYEAMRADLISKPGLITSQVISHLTDDPLVVADLTGHNPNVFYELAIRHAVRKPIVQIIERGETIPFDVASSRTIQVDYHDLDSVDACKKELVAQIRSAEGDPAKVDNPLSLALDLQALRHSENPLEKSNAKIILMLQDILSMFEHLGDVFVPPVLDPVIITEYDRIVRLLRDLASLLRLEGSQEPSRVQFTDAFGIVLQLQLELDRLGVAFQRSREMSEVLLRQKEFFASAAGGGELSSAGPFSDE